MSVVIGEVRDPYNIPSLGVIIPLLPFINEAFLLALVKAGSQGAGPSILEEKDAQPWEMIGISFVDIPSVPALYQSCIICIGCSLPHRVWLMSKVPMQFLWPLFAETEMTEGLCEGETHLIFSASCLMCPGYLQGSICNKTRHILPFICWSRRGCLL